jgi:hypothetical protein
MLPTAPPTMAARAARCTALSLLKAHRVSQTTMQKPTAERRCGI